MTGQETGVCVDQIAEAWEFADPLRNELPEGDNHPNVGSVSFQEVEAFRITDLFGPEEGDVSIEGQRGHRGGASLTPSPSPSVGLADHTGDFVSGRHQSFQGRQRDLGCSEECHPQRVGGQWILLPVFGG